MLKAKWKVRSLPSLPEEEEEGRDPGQRTVVLQKVGKGDAGEGVLCTVPLLGAARESGSNHPCLWEQGGPRWSRERGEQEAGGSREHL